MQDVTWDQIVELVKLPDSNKWGPEMEERIRQGHPLTVTGLPPDAGSRTFRSAEDFSRWYETLRLDGGG